MRTSVPGSSAGGPTFALRAAVLSALARPRGAHRSTATGFTLIELLLVVAIIAIAAGGVGLALRDSDANRLERDAERLAAVLESARAQSRASGVPVRWVASSDGFRLEGLGHEAQGLQTWQLSGLVVLAPQSVLLGPEPILEPLSIELSAPGHRLRVATDGLRPFSVRADTPGSEVLR